MLKLLMGAIALAIVTLPAAAQTTAPSGGGQVNAPSGQNSGAGIPGKPRQQERSGREAFRGDYGLGHERPQSCGSPTRFVQDSWANWKQEWPSGNAAVTSEVADYPDVRELKSGNVVGY